MTRTRARNLGILALMLALPAAADPHSEAIWQADASNGADLYTSQCQACHGQGGNSLVPEQPILAGQAPEYIAEQSFQYRDGERVSSVMMPFVGELSDSEIYDIAAYLGQVTGGLSGVGDMELAITGQGIYRKGIPERGVPNCTGCHGPAGKGIPPEYPRLSGQHAAYTAKTLREFRDGGRTNLVMNEVVAGLTDADIDALAEYIAGLY